MQDSRREHSKVLSTIPINNVGKIAEGEEGNITIPMEFNWTKTIAILDIRVNHCKKINVISTGENWL